MRFYQIDNALDEAIKKGDSAVRVRIAIDRSGHFENVFGQDILDASFFCLKEAGGGNCGAGGSVIG